MEVLKMIKEYCYECDKNVSITIKEENLNTEIKGIEISYTGRVAYCDECQNEVYISSLSDENIEKANQKYRELHGIIKTIEIQGLLDKYDIGQKPLAKLLGWGETTIVRYIQGLMPTKEYSNRLKELFDPTKMKELLDNNRSILTRIAQRKLEAKILEFVRLNQGFDSEVIGVANFFLEKIDEEAGEAITPLKIQKLVYYAQSWMLAFFNRTLFSEELEAWQHGPVVPELYYYFKNLGYNSNDSLPKVLNFDESIFNDEERSILQMVWSVYGKFDGKYLEKLTHSEGPWQKAWSVWEEKDKGSVIIDKESIIAFYSDLKASLNITPNSIVNLHKIVCFL